MKKRVLIKKLIDDQIPEYAFNLNGGLPAETYCLNKNGDLWEVYYSEKGLKSGLQIFPTEEEACDYFYQLIRTDQILYPKQIK